MEQSDAERQLVGLLRGLDVPEFSLQISIKEKRCPRSYVPSTERAAIAAWRGKLPAPMRRRSSARVRAKLVRNKSHGCRRNGPHRASLHRAHEPS